MKEFSLIRKEKSPYNKNVHSNNVTDDSATYSLKPPPFQLKLDIKASDGLKNKQSENILSPSSVATNQPIQMAPPDGGVKDNAAEVDVEKKQKFLITI